MTLRLFSALLLLSASIFASARPRQPETEQARAAYLSRIGQRNVATESVRTPGSLWSPDGGLIDLGSDYKARHLNDTIIIRVYEQTSAQASGNVAAQRDSTTQSAITGLAGRVNTAGVNPLLQAQSSTALKGQGQTASASTLRTSLSGHVIAMLPNGNLAVEAARTIVMNHQHETFIVRGVVRPQDISSDNAIASTSLTDLEIELKGKGVISDATRPPNAVMRAIHWLIGF